MRTKAIFAAMLLALAPLPSVAQDFDVGLAAYEKWDYAAALREWTPLAEQGHADAQLRLADMYSRGRGVLEDYAEATRLYRLAAVQGNVKAQVNLGIMYALVPNTREEFEFVKAHMWYNIAAANGNDTAPFLRDNVEEWMLKRDISEAQRRARICIESNYQDCE